MSEPNAWYDRNIHSFVLVGILHFVKVGCKTQSRCPSLMHGMTKTFSFVLLGILHFETGISL